MAFVELIKPNTNFEFIGHQRFFIGASLLLILISIVMLPINAAWRGHALNYGVDFRGGSELEVHFSKEFKPGQIREALNKAGYKDADVVKVANPFSANAYKIQLA